MPQAAAVCDRCGFVYNWVDLKWQHDYRGPVVQNLRILVCDKCLDEVNGQLRAITLPADPTPIQNARVQDFDIARSQYRSLSRPTVTDPTTGIPIPGTTLRITEDNQNRSVDPYGVPVGLTQAAVMPYDGAVQKAFGVPLQLLSVTADDSPTIAVTCSAVHNLHTNDQISVNDLAYSPACGFYSVTVTTATAFTYMTYGANPAGAYLTPATRMVTCLVGLP